MAKVPTSDVVTNANSSYEEIYNGLVTGSCMPNGVRAEYSPSLDGLLFGSGVYGEMETQYTDRFSPDFYINGGTP